MSQSAETSSTVRPVGVTAPQRAGQPYAMDRPACGQHKRGRAVYCRHVVSCVRPACCRLVCYVKPGHGHIRPTRAAEHAWASQTELPRFLCVVWALRREHVAIGRKVAHICATECDRGLEGTTQRGTSALEKSSRSPHRCVPHTRGAPAPQIRPAARTATPYALRWRRWADDLRHPGSARSPACSRAWP